MCGIAGYVGTSKNPDLSFEIISGLFREIESRGKDASGYWGVSESDQVLFHKEPTPSSDFVRSDIWKSVREHNPSTLICHAREASKGVGPPSDNSNNHPFVSEDMTVALVHNGRIPDETYVPFKHKHQLKSDCDSEVLLKMFENEPEDFLNKVSAIRTIRHIPDAHMAVAIGEKLSEGQRLWIFRNEHRALCKVDLVDQLGQFFFVSTQDIWENATKSLGVKGLVEELDSDTLYMFRIEGSVLFQSAFFI
jgi:glucosamine 6-phosphate synthetase-like amidotransferase/phosphosugar isomerase protein